MATTVDLFHTVLDPGPPDVADANTLLLVHGWGGAGREWSPQAEVLAAAEHRVIVPDLRGHGRSPVLDEDNTPVAMAQDLTALIGATESPRTWLPARPVALPARSSRINESPSRNPRVNLALS
ncbi:alpha/beta fold hydrolase [Streptomyces sp. NPDC048254]|uniref:alpha/beta fold hydrolase n=1 Tax=Streptomyces sp. NPDC048254 TaxID=3365525 RepID=UPI003716842E